MLANGFPEKIDFTEEECAKYHAFDDKVHEEIEVWAKSYMQEEIAMWQALEQIHKLPEIQEYTLDLLFVLACTGYLEERYQKNGVAEEIFIDTMRDIKHKLDECMTTKGVFGIFVVGWYDLFFRGDLMALGRLQYRTMQYNDVPVTVLGKDFTAEDRVVDCHIPSSGPLTRDLLLDSYKRAYAMYPEYRINGVLPIRCHSWLLYPPYEKVFATSKNITGFRNDFSLFSQEQHERFEDSWRVFGADSDDIEMLPETTSLQKTFKEYIKEGGTFGAGVGFILFDGEKVIHQDLLP